MGLQQLFEKLALVGVEWVVWILVLLSMVSIGLMVERGLFFRRKRKDDIPEMMERLRKFLAGGDLNGAKRFLGESQGVEAAVAKAGLEEAHRGAASAEEAMIGARVREKLSLERYLAFLGTVGNNAPFLGLFGTVTGIIKSFHALAVTANPNMKTVMFGIAEALVTTALGLIVAIPAVVAFNIFQRQIRGIMTRTETMARVVLAHIKAEPSAGAALQTDDGTSQKKSKKKEKRSKKEDGEEGEREASTNEKAGGE